MRSDVFAMDDTIGSTELRNTGPGVAGWIDYLGIYMVASSHPPLTLIAEPTST